MPPGPGVAAVLRDARFFLLPEEVTINGVATPIGSVGQGPFESVMEGVISCWESFDRYVERVVAQTKRAWSSLVQVSQDIKDDYFDGKVDFDMLRPHSIRLADVEEGGRRKWR